MPPPPPPRHYHGTMPYCPARALPYSSLPALITWTFVSLLLACYPLTPMFGGLPAGEFRCTFTTADRWWLLLVLCAAASTFYRRPHILPHLPCLLAGSWFSATCGTLLHTLARHCVLRQNRLRTCVISHFLHAPCLRYRRCSTHLHRGGFATPTYQFPPGAPFYSPTHAHARTHHSSFSARHSFSSGLRDWRTFLFPLCTGSPRGTAGGGRLFFAPRVLTCVTFFHVRTLVFFRVYTTFLAGFRRGGLPFARTSIGTYL